MNFEQGGKCKDEVDFDTDIHDSFKEGADGMEFGLNFEHGRFEHDGFDLLFERGGKFEDEVDFNRGLHVGTWGRRRRGRPLAAPRCQNKSQK